MKKLYIYLFIFSSLLSCKKDIIEKVISNLTIHSANYKLKVNTVDYGYIAINKFYIKDILIENNTDATVTLTEIIYPNNFSGEDIRGKKIIGHSLISIPVKFHPSSIETYKSKIIIKTNFKITLDINVMGTAINNSETDNGSLKIVKDTILDFVAKNKTSITDFNIYNNQNFPISIIKAIYPKDFSGNFNGKILSKANKKFNLTFSPTEKKEYKNELLQLITDSNDTLKVNINTLSINKNILKIEGDTNFNFVAKNKISNSSFNVNNIFDFPITIIKTIYPEDFNGNFKGKISGKSKIYFKLNFSPTENKEYKNQIIKIITDTDDTLKLGITASSIYKNNIIVLDTNFGNVEPNKIRIKQLNITHNCNFNFDIVNIDYPKGFSGLSSVKNIIKNENRQLEITFTPTEEKTYNGILKLTTDFGIVFYANLIAQSTKNTNTIQNLE